MEIAERHLPCFGPQILRQDSFVGSRQAAHSSDRDQSLKSQKVASLQQELTRPWAVGMAQQVKKLTWSPRLHSCDLHRHIHRSVSGPDGTVSWPCWQAPKDMLLFCYFQLSIYK